MWKIRAHRNDGVIYLRESFKFFWLNVEWYPSESIFKKIKTSFWILVTTFTVWYNVVGWLGAGASWSVYSWIFWWNCLLQCYINVILICYTGLLWLMLVHCWLLYYWQKCKMTVVYRVNVIVLFHNWRCFQWKLVLISSFQFDSHDSM